MSILVIEKFNEGNYRMKKISPRTLVLEYKKYYFEPDEDLRFGQYMYNKYLSDTDPDPELFYEKNMDAAFAMIANKYMEHENE